MANIFQDIAEKFKLLPELGKQLLKTAESQATAKRLETQLAERQKPVQPTIQTGGFFSDIATKYNLAKPQEFIKQPAAAIPYEGSTISAYKGESRKISPAETIKRQQEAAEQLGLSGGIRVVNPFRAFPGQKDYIVRPPVGIEPLIGGLIELPERITSNFEDVGRGIVEIFSKGQRPALTQKPERLRVPSFVDDAKSFYSTAKEKGFSEGQSVSLALIYATGLALMDFGIATDIGASGVLKITKFNPAVNAALTRRGLADSFTFDAWAKNTKLQAANLAKTGDVVAGQQLLQDTKIIADALYGEGITQARGISKIIQDTAVKIKTPIGAKPVKPYNLAGGKALPGEAIVGEPQPAFGLSIRPVKKVGGVPEVPKVQPLAQEARKYKSAEEFVKAQKYNIPKKNTNLKFSEELRSQYDNQYDMTLRATKNDDIVGQLDYSEFEGIPEIKFIKVLPKNQKQGIGGDLVKELQKTYPDKTIEWGMMTPEGTALKSSLDKELTDIWKEAQAVKGEVKAPSLLAKTEDILAGEMKAKPIVGELPPKAPPTELPPTTLPRATEVLPLKETGERYTTKELSSDILYQKTGVPSSAIKEAETIAKELPTNPTKWNRFTNTMGKFTTSFKEKIVSDWQRVKELKTEGMKLTSELTPYERRKLMAGRQTARLQKAEEVVRKIDKDILDTSHKLKIKDTELQNEVFDYLKARHAPERNTTLGENAAGITTKEAGEITARLEKSPHATEIKRIADDLQKFHNETLDILYQGGKPEGVISKELYDLLKTKYKNHIPLQRVMETDDIAEVLSGRGLAVKGTGLKRAVGSEREVKDIMENIYTARTQAIQRVEKNIVDNETFRFAEDYIKTFPEQELFEIIKPQAIGKTFEGKIITKQINSPDILQFQRFGEPAYIKINDPRLAVALRGVNREQMPAVMRYISTVTRWMSALVTRYSPEFALSNKIRDMQEAVVYMASQDGFRGAAKTAFRDPASINDVKNFVLGKETAGTKLYVQMIEDGGTTGGMALSTRKQVKNTLQNIRSTNRNIARKGFKALAESVDKWNTVFEDSTRLSAYKTALESGLSREKAAIISKNVSIDFNEFGTWGPIVNALYMFANASIQGSAKMIRAMKNPKVAAVVVATVGGAVFAANSWNDKVDSDWRNKVSKWDKLNGLNIVIPGTEEFYYISIPVSWGLKPIKVAIEYGTDVLSGQTVGLGDATEGIFTAVLEGYNPVGGTDLASALTPSPIEPFIDIARNRQWTGGKIRPDWNKYAPASTQYFKDLKDSTTGKYLISISQSVAEKTGGRIEISPADAEYVLQQITGGPGKFTSKTFNSISAIGKGEVPEVRDIPFLSRVFRNTPEERFYTSKGEVNIIKTLTEQERKRFYDKQEAEKVFEELKKMPTDQRKETYKRLKEEKPQLIERVNKIADDEEKNLTRLDRQILNLGVENGQRAKYLFKVFKSAEPQERKELYREYLKKGIISDDVREQLDYLFANPDKIK